MQRLFSKNSIRTLVMNCKWEAMLIKEIDGKYCCDALCNKTFRKHRGALKHITEVHRNKEKLKSTDSIHDGLCTVDGKQKGPNFSKQKNKRHRRNSKGTVRQGVNFC